MLRFPKARGPHSAPLETNPEFSRGKLLRRFLGDFLFGMFRNLHTFGAQTACSNSCAHLLGLITRPPVGMLHDERTRLARTW